MGNMVFNQEMMLKWWNWKFTARIHMAVKPHKRYAGYAYMIETNMDHVWNQVAGATVSVSINKVWAPGTVNIQC